MKEPRLYNLEQEIGELTDVAGKNPEVVSRLTKLATAMSSDIGSGKAGPGVRPPGRVAKPVTLYRTAAARRRPPKTVKPLNWNKVQQGESYATAEAGNLVKRDFSVRFEIDLPTEDSVLVAHGGTALGYVVYTKAGNLVFAVRTSSEQIGRVDVPLGDAKQLTVVAEATKTGIQLNLNGKVSGSDFPARLERQPQEDFCLGHDNGNPVDSSAPTAAAFKGGFRKVELRVK